MGCLMTMETANSARTNSRPSQQEVRCAVRFPLVLSVQVSTDEGDFIANTQNVSASGVLFEMDHSIQTGTLVRFSLRMPGNVLGMEHDVLVLCNGRVVRCTLNQTKFQTAATIDDYQFVEQ
jgi:hypothetical protein